MVADTYYSTFNFRRLVNCNRWKFSRCAIHLHVILKTHQVEVKQQDRYKTILVIVTGLLAIALIFELRWLMISAMIIGLVSIFSSIAARWIEWAWLKIALALGYINSRILLSVIYFIFLMPLAWISRLFTKDPLVLRKRKTASLFIERNHLYTKKDLENIW